MNLFYKPSLSELASLIEQSTKDSENYNVIVDYDGEVLIDSEANLSKKVLDRYKFYFPKLRESFSRGKHSISYLKYLSQLFKNLVFCWDKEISGNVDYQLISNIQSRMFNRGSKEMNEVFFINLLNSTA
jgi:hypothetical protein